MKWKYSNEAKNEKTSDKKWNLVLEQFLLLFPIHAHAPLHRHWLIIVISNTRTSKVIRELYLVESETCPDADSVDERDGNARPSPIRWTARIKRKRTRHFERQRCSKLFESVPTATHKPKKIEIHSFHRNPICEIRDSRLFIHSFVLIFSFASYANPLRSNAGDVLATWVAGNYSQSGLYVCLLKQKQKQNSIYCKSLAQYT